MHKIRENINHPIPQYDVFISYSRDDSSIVRRIVERLIEAGLTVWVDINEITVGDEFKRRITTGLANSSIMLFISSIHSNVSDWTAKEIGYAVTKKIPIIPIRLDNSPYNELVLFDLVNIDFIFLSEKSNFDKTISTIINSVRKKLVSKEFNILSDPITLPSENNSVISTHEAFNYRRYWKGGVIIATALIIGIGGYVWFARQNTQNYENSLNDRIKISEVNTKVMDSTHIEDSIHITLNTHIKDDAHTPIIDQTSLERQFTSAKTTDELKALADKKFIKAYAPLSERYLKEKDYFNAYEYAQKAISSKYDVALADTILSKLKKLGFRPEEKPF